MVLDVPAPKEFSVSTDPSTVAQRWKRWIAAFQFYLIAIGITSEERKRALLLHVAGTETQDIFATLTTTEDTCKAAIEALNTYFSPKINVRYERFLFRQCTHEQNESVDTFVTKLRKLAVTCEFTDINDVIIDQVIEKCNSHELRKKLLQEKNLTLDKVQGIARTLEAANVQAKSIEGRPNVNDDSQVKVVMHNQQKQGKKGNNFRTRDKFMQNKFPYSSQSQHVNISGKHRARPGQCFRCGKEGHYPSDKEKCPATGKKCHSCGRVGHFSNLCKSDKPKIHYTSGIVTQQTLQCKGQGNVQPTLSDEDFAFQINSLSRNDRRIMITVTVNDKPITMQLDTAADVSVMSQNVAHTIPRMSVKSCNKVLRDYNNQNIDVVGTAKVDVQYDQQKVKNLSITIVKGHGQTLLGLDWLKHLTLDWQNIFKVLKLSKDTETPLSNVLSQFKKVFEEGLGTVINAKAVLTLKTDATPKFLAPRPIPYALRSSVEQEIKRLEADNAWERVTYSDWATPLVPIAKSDGGVRLCGDYKVTLNPQLQVAQHPLPNPTDMFAALAGCTVFSKIDLKQAFQQLSMDERSQELCTLNTHLGLFRPKRLPYGVASSPAIWQQTMDKIFAGLPGVFCFVDDILIAGKDVTEHQARLNAVLERIQENGMKIHRNKCSFGVSSVEYLGFIIDGQGVHKTNEKVRAVQTAKVPENIKELQSFLGLVTFYGRFIKDLATIAHPLYQLLNNDVEWNWSEECQRSFENIKNEIISPKFLVHFQMDLPVKLVCDASQVGIGAVLAHVMPDGTEKPIAFASRVLNKAEQNYSQIEKEGLSLVYGVKKFHMYLYGKSKFMLVTDHKPLLAILGPKSGLPTLVAARLQRWAIILAAYNYTLEYRSTTKMGNADALSRLPVDKAPEEHENTILLIETLNLPLTAKSVSQSTRTDTVLAKVLQSLITGRDSIMNHEDCKPYKTVWSELSVEQGCILRGSRVVIPAALRERILEEIHADHQGIVRSKAIARSYIWWPGVDKAIESYVKKCEDCANHQNNPKPVRMHPWECPRYAWQRIHIDFAGPFLGHSFLIVVDSYSKWPEIVPMQSTTSLCTIKALMQIFSTHGLPERVVSDNGPQFCSQEFKNFLDVNGIHHTFSAPYHPATNGEAERFVQTFKHNMKCRQANSANISTCIHKFLLAYRTTPHTTTGISPSNLLMGRRIRSKLDLILPDFHREQEHRGWKQLEHQGNIRHFTPSSPVMVRSYNTPDKWIPGEVTREIGKMHYDVNVNGKVMKRHVDQLKPSGVSKECEPLTDQTLQTDTTSESLIPETVLPNLESSPIPLRVLPSRTSRGKPPDRLNL